MPPTFSSAADVDAFFTASTGQDFISWFRARHAKQGRWARVGRWHAGEIEDSPRSRAGFRSVCDNLPMIWGRPASLDEFLCLASVIINETASFTPVSELVGSAGHAGIAYAFDAIPDLKMSYNVAPNKPAGDLLRDPAFIQAHGSKPLGAQLANTTNPVWDGTAFPQGPFPTDTNPAVSGILLECDFYKFRGRGLIQTTWRSNYMRLIDFIQAGNHPHPVIQEYRQRWAGLNRETAATVSSNADWDRLFQQTDGVVAMTAVRLHSEGSGQYLNVSSDTGTLLGKAAGSAFSVGHRVSGSQEYGALFSERVQQLRNGLNLNVVVPPQTMTPHDVEASFFRGRRIGSSGRVGPHTMQAATDFRLPAAARRVRMGVYVSAGPGYLRFFNADGTEAEPVGWGGRLPAFGAVDVTLSPGGSVPFRAEDGDVTTDRIRSLGYWTTA